MADEIEQVPDDMRGRGKDDHRVVPGLREHAKGDPTLVPQLYEGAGYGAHPYAVVAGKVDSARTRLGMSVADGYEGSGDVNYKGATEFEFVDSEGGAAVTRRSKES